MYDENKELQIVKGKNPFDLNILEVLGIVERRQADYLWRLLIEGMQKRLIIQKWVYVEAPYIASGK